MRENFKFIKWVFKETRPDGKHILFDLIENFKAFLSFLLGIEKVKTHIFVCQLSLSQITFLSEHFIPDYSDFLKSFFKLKKKHQTDKGYIGKV